MSDLIEVRSGVGRAPQLAGTAHTRKIYLLLVLFDCEPVLTIFDVCGGCVIRLLLDHVRILYMRDAGVQAVMFRAAARLHAAWWCADSELAYWVPALPSSIPALAGAPLSAGSVRGGGISCGPPVDLLWFLSCD